MNSVKNVANVTPEQITTPSAARLAEPGPSARISGTEPMTAANAVMITGRKRMRDASTMASLNAMPWSRN